MPDTPRPQPTLASTLTALADRVDAHDGTLTHVGLANLLAKTIDGPQATGWTRTSQTELMKAASRILVPRGFLSPVPNAAQVRAAAAAAGGQQ